MSSEQQAVGGPLGPAPVRRPGSIRRTSTIEFTWPTGFGKAMAMDGRARDAFTPAGGGGPRIIDETRVSATITLERTIEAITVEPANPGIAGLVGCRGGGHLRSAIEEHLPGQRESGTPLYLVLDDISGTSLIAGFAWSRWGDEWQQHKRDEKWTPTENICMGFATGNSSLIEMTQDNRPSRVHVVGSLVNPEDPQGWHDTAPHEGVHMQRARRIDVWLEDGVIQIDSSFRDSASDPHDHRVAIHEYALRATADPATMTVTSAWADPRILPFMECPAAARTVEAIVGAPLAQLRTAVLERLARQKGCTHLNDAMRALAEVPVLVSALEAATA